MVNGPGDTGQPDTAATREAPAKPRLDVPERRGWSQGLAPSGGLFLGLLLGVLAWLAAFTLWRVLG